MAKRPRCTECRRRYTPAATTSDRQKTCGPACRLVRRRKQARARRRRDPEGYRTAERARQRTLALVDLKWEAIAKVVADSERVDDPYQVDLYSLASALASHDGKAKVAAAPVIAQLAAMLVDRAAGDGHRDAHGLSIFCPKTSDVDLIDAYRGIEFRTRPWAAFLRGYQAKLKSYTGDE